MTKRRLNIKRLLYFMIGIPALVFVPYYVGGFADNLFSLYSGNVYSDWVIGFLVIVALLFAMLLIYLIIPWVFDSIFPKQDVERKEGRK